MYKCYKYLFILLLYTSCACTSGTNNNSNRIAAGADTLKMAEVLPAPEEYQSDSIKKYSKLLKKLYVEFEPSGPAETWFLPFDVPDRSDMDNITTISGYGANRSTRVKGHKHSGIDLVPTNPKNPLDVYAVSTGVVCFVNQEAPVKTVIIKHELKDGSVIYSSYIHLKDIFTERGRAVDETTKIGVLYTKKEALKYGGNFDHLHFEIKKRIDDYSCASWLCMSREELDEYFSNPYVFFKEHLKVNSIQEEK
jgi:murein DD-endopeptidase MepM/ murein hydrolase activator NlpD